MKKLLSAIQPSNKLTLGNYFGAIKNFIELQNQYDCYIFVADLHVLTNPKIDTKSIMENKKMMVSFYKACGLDLEKCKVFYQSDIPAHTELAHILMCNSYMGELSRMTQFKDKASKLTNANGTETIPAGLFTYPVLMAADILLYDADIVPVGNDQKQHLELARNLAERMNNKYGNLFIVPDAFIPKQGARIMDLLDPTIKMSKSNANEKGTIFLLDSLEDINTKIMGAKTDSLNHVKFDPINQPGISNLMSMYSLITNLTFDQIEKKFNNQNYGVFKKDLSAKLCAFLGDIQNKYNNIYKNYDKEIAPILEKNKALINNIANQKIENVYRKIGIK